MQSKWFALVCKTKRHGKRPAGLKRNLLCDLKKTKISTRKVEVRMGLPLEECRSIYWIRNMDYGKVIALQ